MKAQWLGDNLAEIETLLTHHLARIRLDDDRGLHITGLGGLDVRVGLGDILHVRGDGLGIERPPDPGPPEEFVWSGFNISEIANFLAQWDMDIEVIGNQLKIHAPEGEPAFLDRGDKLLKRGKLLFVSRAGKDHRA